MADALKVDEEALLVVARQVKEQHRLSLDENPYHTSSILRITMLGIEEAERMGQPLLKKLADEYPFLYQCCWSSVTLLVGSLLLWLLGWKK